MTRLVLAIALLAALVGCRAQVTEESTYPEWDDSQYQQQLDDAWTDTREWRDQQGEYEENE